MFSTLEGDTALDSPRTLTPLALQELQFVEQRLNDGFLTYLICLKPILFVIFHAPYSPSGVIAQEKGLIEWVFLPNSFSKKLTAYMDKLAFLIQKGRHRILQLSGYEPYQIVTQLTTAQISRCLQFNENWQISLASYPGSFSNHYPSSKLIDFLRTNTTISHSPISDVPINRPTIFTDANKNTTIDALLYPIEAAKQEHLLQHTNSKGLQKSHAITQKQAQNIVHSCSICAPFALPFTPPGVNMRGQQANQIWQMDVIYISSFGQQKCVHHTIDTCTHFQWATALHSEKADAVITHLLSCFAVMGLPIELKTDNAPAYQSAKLAHFLSQYHITHTFGIPYNSQGQAIIERANRTLREYLEKIKKGEQERFMKPKDILNKTLLTLNFLNIWSKGNLSAAELHFQGKEEDKKILNTPIWYKDKEKGWIPASLIYLGRGYAFISVDNYRFWTPARLIKINNG